MSPPPGCAAGRGPAAARGARVLLSMRNIHVDYERVHALKGVDFDLYEGEIHALVGEHRAGKSSLVKLLSGAVQKSAGEISYLGREVRSFTPESALEAGIGMVYQDLSVLPSLSAVENIFAGRMLRGRLGALDHVRMLASAHELLERLNLDIDLEAPLYSLTLAQQIKVELARILLLDPRIMILDELSHKLTPDEMAAIYPILFEVRARGRGVIYITHDVEETLRLADRVTILKDGYRRGTEQVADLDQERLLELTYSFALGKREMETARMRFAALKRYSESLTRRLPIGLIMLDPGGELELVELGVLAELAPGGAARGPLADVLEGLGIPVAAEILAAVAAREERVWDEVPCGEEKLLRVDVFPLRDEAEAFAGTAVLLQDVSIDRYMRDYIIRAEKMATLAQVAAGVAHEINNPLFIVRNYVELLKPGAAGERAEKLDKIEKELARVDRIIGSLLSFSRFKERPESRTNLVEVIDEALLLLQHALSQKNVRLERRIEADRVEIVGDENRLKQLFLNLILNGIDAVLDGGLIRVTLERNEQERTVEVSVADNGYGIPQDIQARIFEPFFTTKVNKKNTGLGLAICQQIAEAHRGAISFSSAPAELTEFVVHLPVE